MVYQYNTKRDFIMPLSIYFDCYPCMLRQVLHVVRYLELDEETTRELMNQAMEKLIHINGDLTSAEIAAEIHQSVSKKIGKKDPYAELKRISFENAMQFYDFGKEKILASPDPLETAVKLCTAGNIIDFGPGSKFDLEATIDQVLNTPFEHFDYAAFKEILGKAKRILFLADNAGETVFDKLLIEQIKKPLKYVVKSEPIMNDALREDAEMTEFPDYVTIIENGSGIQGTVFPHCSEEFKKKYEMADMIIAKGMANFETLPKAGERVFFLLKIKCQTIANLSGIPFESYVLKQGGLFI